MASLEQVRRESAGVIMMHARRLDAWANSETKNRRDKASSVSSLAAIRDSLQKMRLPKRRESQIVDAVFSDLSLVGKYEAFFVNELGDWL